MQCVRMSVGVMFVVLLSDIPVVLAAKTTMMDNLSCLASTTFIKSTITLHSHYAHQHFSLEIWTAKYYHFGFLVGSRQWWRSRAEGEERHLLFSHKYLHKIFFFFLLLLLFLLCTFSNIFISILFHGKHVNARIYTQRISDTFEALALREH